MSANLILRKLKNHLNLFGKKDYLKIVIIVGLTLNLYATIYGIIHIIVSNYYLSIPNIFGLLLLISWTYNLIFIAFRGISSQDYKVWRWSESYLYLSIFSPLLMILGNFLVSASYYQTHIILYSLITYISFFVLSFGGFILFWYVNRSIFGKKDIKIIIKPRKKYGKIRTFVYKAIMVYSGLYSLSLMNGSANYGAGTLASSSQVSLAFFFTFSSIFVILIKMKPRIKHFALIFFIGWFTIGTSFLPLISSQYTINYAENQFNIAFGYDWGDKVKPANSYFLQQQFSLTEYFLGIPPKDCILEKDILYYTGEGIRLYYDVYIPKTTNLPGNNSVIISIHGGGWTGADKGFTNKVQVNKYFAAQGYVVFDIQYGLRGGEAVDLLTPYYVRGNFTIDDMIRHIGIFTDYLVNHSVTLNANINSVFITGGSSGGNLACAVALAYTNTSFSHYFNPLLKIKGLIPYYPANGIAKSVLGIEGSPELINPELLVSVNSPPCLIFHGTSDGIVNPASSKLLQDEYRAHSNTKCALIQLLYAGHVSDYYFSGIFSQTCLYYMERFLYLYH